MEGVAARASGVDIDVRRDFPYAAYDEIPPNVVLHSKGDVFDRMRVRIEEADDSIRIALEALGRLSAGPVSTALPPIPLKGALSVMSRAGEGRSSIGFSPA